MFDTIILLTGPAEQPILAEVLRRQNPRLTVHAVETLPALEALDPGLFPRARLIGFATPTVVPTQILERLGFGGYNFHPGPPHYPGWVPAHSAIYDGATEFGATAHIMIERVDAGPIVGVEQFGIPPHTGVVRLEELAYAQLAQLFWRLANMLAAQSEPLPVLPVRWSGQKSTRRSFAAMCEIQNDISKKELERRIEAFGIGKLDLRPAITLHGHRFGYIAPDAETIVDAPSIVPAEPLTAVPA
jgi:methionyl-tRNA formyltransferase